MSSLSFSISRKRHHFPEFRDDSDSEELPPKRHKNGDLPIVFKTKLQQMTSWFWELRSINRFIRMALRCGATLPMHHHPDEFEDDSDEEDEEEDDDDDIEDHDDEDDDDDIQEIKENVNQEKISPLVKQFGKSHLSSDSGRSKQQLAINGSYSLGSYSNPHKLNGARELSTRYHGTTNCSIRREETNKLKRKPLISNPSTEVEILLGPEPEVVILEGDGIEILSESPSSKQKRATSQKSFRSSAKSSSSKSSASAFKQTPVKKIYSSSPKSYTANEVVRLQEKAQYQLLLEKYISGAAYHPICKKSQSDAEVKEDARVFSTSHFKKEVLQQPIDNFIEKYYTPCRLLSPKAKETSEKKEPPPEITIDDDDEEDEVQILNMKLPQYKTVFKTQLFTKDWLSELQEHVHAQTEERNKIVEDYELKLEQLKKERLLRRLRTDASVSKPAEPEFPELTPEMEDAVDNVLNTGAPDDKICKIANNDCLLRKDFDTLTGLKWLNDAIINSYFDLILERSKKEGYPSVYAFNTFFYSSVKTKGYSSVRRWTRKVDIFSYDINFVPMHLAFHWCLAVIDHRSKKVCYYDSMGNGEEECLRVLHDYLCQEYKDKKGKPLDPSVYVTETMKDIPQQMNGSDCGMFTLKYAEYLARNAEITFDQQQMQYFRRRTVYELLTNQLL